MPTWGKQQMRDATRQRAQARNGTPEKLFDGFSCQWYDVGSRRGQKFLPDTVGLHRGRWACRGRVAIVLGHIL